LFLPEPVSIRCFKSLLPILVPLWLTVQGLAQPGYKEQWPQFRGPFASGMIDSLDLPEK
jgi:hypothetical protein